MMTSTNHRIVVFRLTILCSILIFGPAVGASKYWPYIAMSSCTDCPNYPSYIEEHPDLYLFDSLDECCNYWYAPILAQTCKDNLITDCDNLLDDPFLGSSNDKASKTSKKAKKGAKKEGKKKKNGKKDKKSTTFPTLYDNTPGPAPAACEQETAANTEVNKCYYEKEITTKDVPCDCGETGCPNPDGQTSGCKRDVTMTSCPSVDVYSSSATYEAGDVVRLGSSKYQCINSAYSAFCSMDGYEPGSGLYSTLAWSEIGECPP